MRGGVLQWTQASSLMIDVVSLVISLRPFGNLRIVFFLVKTHPRAGYVVDDGEAMMKISEWKLAGVHQGTKLQPDGCRKMP